VFLILFLAFVTLLWENAITFRVRYILNWLSTCTYQARWIRPKTVRLPITVLRYENNHGSENVRIHKLRITIYYIRRGPEIFAHAGDRVYMVLGCLISGWYIYIFLRRRVKNTKSQFSKESRCWLDQTL
jgi:hypothetical protein